jgi:hypothetical protein
MITTRRQSNETSTQTIRKNTKNVLIDITQAEAGHIKHMEVMHDVAAASTSLVDTALV